MRLRTYSYQCHDAVNAFATELLKYQNFFSFDHPGFCLSLTSWFHSYIQKDLLIHQQFSLFFFYLSLKDALYILKLYNWREFSVNNMDTEGSDRRFLSVLPSHKCYPILHHHPALSLVVRINKSLQPAQIQHEKN